MKLVSINDKFILSEDKMNKLYETRFDIPRLFLNGRDVITAGQLYEFIPWEVYINQDVCEIAVGNDIIDREAVYIVSYVRKKDGWIAQSFSATTLQDALYEMIMWCDDNNLIPQSSILWISEDLTQEIYRPVNESCQTTTDSNKTYESTYTLAPDTTDGNITNTMDIKSDYIKSIYQE